MTLSVLCYWWTDKKWADLHAKSFRYTADHVRRLQWSVSKCLPLPHKFICATDDPLVFKDDPDIHVAPLALEAHVEGKEWVKLQTFHPKARDLFGVDQVLQL